MRRFSGLLRCAAAVLGGSVVWLAAQTPLPPGGVRRALIITNTIYRNLPRVPAEPDGVRALEEVLRDAQFTVNVARDLDLDSLKNSLEGFSASLQANEVSLLYYSGYAKKELRRTYLLPVSFDPNSEIETYFSAYELALIQDSLAAKKPLLSMTLLDASWDAPQLAGRAGLAQLAPPSKAWVFASADADHVTTKSQITLDKIGLFTSALIKVLPQHGLDLPDLVAKVKTQVEEASKGAQQPRLWSGDVPKFHFHLPDSSGERVNERDRQKYVFIRSAKFWMGCVPVSDELCQSNEKPRHRVDITKGFWLGQNEVTNLAYNERFARDTNRPRKKAKGITDAGKSDNLPVVNVSWEEAQKYCQWAADGGRLPTEAEWELAARAGDTEDVYPYPDLKTSRKFANFSGKEDNDIFDDIAPVAQFNPNRYNLFDMAGNVWEWVSDWFSSTYYQESSKVSPVLDPQGPPSAEKGKGRVARGGSWYSDPKKHLRISYRESFKSDSNVIGFRCVIPDTPEARKVFVN